MYTVLEKDRYDSILVTIITIYVRGLSAGDQPEYPELTIRMEAGPVGKPHELLYYTVTELS